jgi:hypothetical protein
MRKAAAVLLAMVVPLGVSCSSSGAPQKPVQGNAIQLTSAPTVEQPAKRPDDLLGTTRPETVRAESVRVVKGVKMLSVGNGQGHYQLSCNTSQDSCVTPVPDRDYLLFTKETRWKKPGAKDFLTLKWLQDWSGSYNNEENIALIPADDEGTSIGIYWLHSWDKTDPKDPLGLFEDQKPKQKN